MTSPVCAAQFRAWFQQYDELLAWMNGSETPDPGGTEEECARVERLERAIMETPAADFAGSFVRLLTATHISAHGANISDEQAAKLVAEAIGFMTPAAADQAAFDAALAEYRRVRAMSDALEGDGVKEADGRWTCDRLVDDYCLAMDHLIENVRAPTFAALRIKFDIIDARCADGCGWFETYRRGFMEDLDYLEAKGIRP